MKNVLFVDFNGVISYNPFWITLRNAEHPLHAYHKAIEHYLFTTHTEVARDWMVGKYTSEDIHRILEKEVGVPYDTLFPIFEDECAHIDISHRILEKIATLKESYYCTLITDNMDSFDRFTLPHNPVLSDTFDRIDNSYTMKRYKHFDGGAYFREVVRECGASIAHSILIDDSARNGDLFESIGGKAYITQTEEGALATLDDIHLHTTAGEG